MSSPRSNTRVFDIFTFLQERQKTDFLVFLKCYTARLIKNDSLWYDKFFDTIIFVTYMLNQLYLKGMSIYTDATRILVSLTTVYMHHTRVLLQKLVICMLDTRLWSTNLYEEYSKKFIIMIRNKHIAVIIGIFNSC